MKDRDMSSDETMDQRFRRAAELRALAAKSGDQFRRDWLTAAAESYEKLVSEPLNLAKRG